MYLRKRLDLNICNIGIYFVCIVLFPLQKIILNNRSIKNTSQKERTIPVPKADKQKFHRSIRGQLIMIIIIAKIISTMAISERLYPNFLKSIISLHRLFISGYEMFKVKTNNRLNAVLFPDDHPVSARVHIRLCL